MILCLIIISGYYVFDGLDDSGKTRIRISSSKQPDKLKNHCLGLWLAPAVQSNGAVLPCCMNQPGIPIFGNISDVRFDAIWNSAAFNSFRKSMLTNRRTILPKKKGSFMQVFRWLIKRFIAQGLKIFPLPALRSERLSLIVCWNMFMI